MRPVSPWLRVLLVPAFFVWLVAALLRVQSGWRGELTAPGTVDLLLIASLPLLAWLWFRYLSVFGKGRGQCLLPPDPQDRSPRGGEN